MYTLEQAKQIQGLTDEQKQVLKHLEDSAKRFNRNERQFNASNVNELKEELNELIAIAAKRKEQRKAKEQTITAEM